jgi:hypothetical protein
MRRLKSLEKIVKEEVLKKRSNVWIMPYLIMAILMIILRISLRLPHLALY